MRKKYRVIISLIQNCSFLFISVKTMTTPIIRESLESIRNLGYSLRMISKALNSLNSLNSLKKVGAVFGHINFFYEKLKKMCEKFWRLKIKMHLCSVKNDKHTWSIHLRARIPASHAGHRGSNPLSTTKKRSCFQLLFSYILLSFLRLW